MLFGLSTKALSAIVSSVLLVGVVIGTAAVMADDDDFGTVEAPEWKAGYAWTYDVSGEMNYDIRVPGEFMESGAIPIPTLKLQKEVLNTEDFVNEGEPLYVGATTLPLGSILDGAMFGLEGDWADLVRWPTADRQRDLAPVLVFPDYEHDGGMSPEMTGLTFGHDTPFNYLQFPLEQGKRWSDTVSLGKELFDVDPMTELGDVTELKLVAETGGMERIRLPVGNTDAVRVDFSYQPIGLERAVAQVRDEIESYGANVERLNIQLGLHEIVHYSPEYEAVVRDQYVLRVLVDLIVTSGDFRAEAYADITGYVVSELTGATLAEVPEYSMQGILDKLNGQEPIADVEGISVEGPVYHVDVAVDRDRVNVFNGESFGVSAGHDAGSLPDGHSLEYAVVDARGVIVKEGTAQPAFGVQLSDPGVYTVFLTARDAEGRLVSEDRDVVYADYIGAFYENCAMGDSFIYANCGEISLPMREGIERVVVTADVNSTLSLLGQDRLELYDASGGRVASSQGGEYRIELNGDDIPVSSEDGYLTFVPEVSMGDQVTYTVALVYGPAGVAQVEYQESAGMLAVTQDARLLGTMLGFVDQTVASALDEKVETPSLLSLF